MSARQDRRDKFASRAVQIGFIVGLLTFWYLGTAYWGISPLLLPNPVKVWHELKDVLGSGEYLPDLQITLTELAVAFSISCTSGVTLGKYSPLPSTSFNSCQTFTGLGNSRGLIPQ